MISESGINHRAQVAALRHHAKGFLVGSSLMAEPDLEPRCASSCSARTRCAA